MAMTHSVLWNSISLAFHGGLERLDETQQARHAAPVDLHGGAGERADALPLGRVGE
jgi:hypothetical protein